MSTQLIRQTARSVTSVTVITSLPVPVTICVPLPHGGVTFFRVTTSYNAVNVAFFSAGYSYG